MNCNTVQKYLYLFRKGELAFFQKLIAKQHIRKCRHCKSLADQITSDYTRLDPLKQMPDLPPELNTDNIIKNLPGRRISDMHAAHSNRYHGARLLLPAAAFFLVLFFGIQQWHINQRMSQLEVRLNSSRQAVPSDAQFQLMSLLYSDLLTPTNESSLMQILNQYSKILDILQEFINEHPELSGIDLNDGLDKKELSKLLKYKEQLENIGQLL